MSSTREYHGNGSYTDRYSNGTSVTKDSDGRTTESTRNESSNPFSILIPGGCTPDVRVTRDSEGHTTKVDSIKK
ncbi:MAG: hypothetical protein Q8Q92_00305 [bacterium]|nr:hypothetical protein [bacterium]